MSKKNDNLKKQMVEINDRLIHLALECGRLRNRVAELERKNDLTLLTKIKRRLGR